MDKLVDADNDHRIENDLNYNDNDDIESESQSDVASYNKHENDPECDGYGHGVEWCFLSSYNHSVDKIGSDVDHNGDEYDDDKGYGKNADVYGNHHDDDVDDGGSIQVYDDDSDDGDKFTSECITYEDDDNLGNCDEENIGDLVSDMLHHDLLPRPNSDGETKTTCNSQGNITKIPSSVQLIKCSDLCSTRKYENVISTLKEYQAHNKWGKHKSLTSCLQRNEVNFDLKIVLSLEQGRAEIFQKHFSLGRKLFRQALQLSLQSKNLCLLQGRALMFLGNAYRQEGPTKYGKALTYLTLAQQKLCLVDSKVDKSKLNYCLAVLYSNLLSISIHEPSQKSRDRIEEHYQAVYDYAMAESAPRVRETIQKLFPLGMANILLDCQTELARSRVVPETKLKKAEDCLKYFANNFPFDEQPVCVQTYYCKSMSDLEYRRGNLPISQELLEQGLKIAKRRDYHLEVQSFEKRLSMLEKCLPRVHVCLPQEDTANFADHSVTADSEVNVFSSGSE